MKATKLLVEGVAPDEIPADFLTGVMDLADDCGMDVDGISILRDERSGDDRERK